MKYRDWDIEIKHADIYSTGGHYHLIAHRKDSNGLIEEVHSEDFMVNATRLSETRSVIDTFLKDLAAMETISSKPPEEVIKNLFFERAAHLDSGTT